MVPFSIWKYKDTYLLCFQIFFGSFLVRLATFFFPDKLQKKKKIIFQGSPRVPQILWQFRCYYIKFIN